MTESDETFLDKIYGDDPDAAARLYADWAQSYDAELTANGYVGPQRCAEALARVAGDFHAPLLDLGCGTGLSGEALAAAGFRTIDGSDFSGEMLEGARAKGIYRALIEGSPETPLPGAPGDYAMIAAVGVLLPGHAPAETIDAALAHLPPGGLLVFSLNDHALAEPSYEGRVLELTDCGAAELLVREHGPHVPGIGLEATVVVLRKAA